MMKCFIIREEEYQIDMEWVVDNEKEDDIRDFNKAINELIKHKYINKKSNNNVRDEKGHSICGSYEFINLNSKKDIEKIKTILSPYLIASKLLQN